MTKTKKTKFTRADAADYLNIDATARRRLAYSCNVIIGADYSRWLHGEFGERDNLLFRLFMELNQVMDAPAMVFHVLREAWENIDEMVESSNRRTLPGVVVVGDKRYVQWPGRSAWFDTWQMRFLSPQEHSDVPLRITTAIHLQTICTGIPGIAIWDTPVIKD